MLGANFRKLQSLVRSRMESSTEEKFSLQTFSKAALELCGEFTTVIEEYLSSGTMPAEWHDALSGTVEPSPAGLGRLVGAFHDSLSSVRRTVMVGTKGTDPFGAVSTPPEMARAVVREALDLLGRPASIIVDPAIGAGSFLAALAEHGGVLENALFIGVDIDPVALCLASFLADHLKKSGHIPASATIKLVRGDALAGVTIRELDDLSPRLFRRAISAKKSRNFNELDITLSFAGAFMASGSLHMLRAAPIPRSPASLEILAPGMAGHLRNFRALMPVNWDMLIGSLPEGGADLVIGNPPWGLLSGRGSPIRKMREMGHEDESRRLALRVSFYRHRFRELSGPMQDLHRWFCALPSRLLTKDGVMAYVIPDSVLHYPSFSDLRAHLADFYSSGTARLLVPFGRKKASMCTLAIKRGQGSLRVEVTDREDQSFQIIMGPDGTVTKSGTLLYRLAAWPRLSEIADMREGSHAIPSPRTWHLTSGGGLRAVDVSRMGPFTVPPVVEISTEKAVPKSHLISGQVGLWRKTGDRPVTAVIQLDKPAVIHQNVYVFRSPGFSPYALSALFNSEAYAALYREISWVRSTGAMAQFRLSHIRMLPVPPFARELTALDRSSGALQLVSIGEMLHSSIRTWLQDGDENEIAALASDALPRMLEGLRQGTELLLKQAEPEVIPRTIHTILHLTGLVLHESKGTPLHDPLVAFAEDVTGMVLSTAWP